GYRKYGSTVRVTADDQFHLGSDTKAMTATLVGMLIEEGKLDWSSKLADLLPELSSSMNEQFKPVTVNMLLAHRGGMPNRSTPLNKTLGDLKRLPGSPREQRFEFIKMMLAETPDYQPGSKYVYSNAGYSLLGVIAEQLTNAPWESLMSIRIFQPLGMTTAG